MLADLASSPLSDADRALFGLVEQMNRAAYDVTHEHIEAVMRAGWSQEAVYDAITVCALFNFYNRWCDATGVHAMAREDHARSGTRMARNGYLPPQPDGGTTPAPGGSRSG